MAAVPESLAATPNVSPVEERYPVEFSGAAGEYFRIWIVNLALTIVSLGIYSAWAKVRRKRYFYANTLIGGEGFEYRGNPVAILRGRVLAVALLAIYGAAGQVSDILQLILGLAFAIAFPWLLVRSLAFNAHNSAYRNIRFHFGGTYLGALKLFALSAALVLFTLGIAYPYARARLAKFSADHHSYGTAQFALPSLTRMFYRIYVRLIGLTLLVVLAILLILLLASFAARFSDAIAAMLMVARVTIVVPLGFAALYLLWFSYPRARIGNVIWNHLAVGRSTAGSPQVRFDSRLRARDLAGLYFVNILAIVFTLGLATAWAVIRTMRYRAQKTTLFVVGGLDQFVAAQAADVGASGEEVGEMFGLDFSF